MSAYSMAAAAWVTAICAVAGVIINMLGWRRHAGKDNRRFAEVSRRLEDDTPDDGEEVVI